MIDYLRLAVATVVVLLPGRYVARAFGQRSTATTVAWAMGCVFVAWAAVFAVGGSVWLAVGILAAIGVAARALAWTRRRKLARPEPGHGIALGFGVVLGMLLWDVAGVVSGDGLFHLARIRKLVDLGDLHLRTVNEFADGGLHPGYAFPLWHGFIAVISKLSGLDPTVVVNHEAALLAPIAVAVGWESGVAVFRSSAAGFAVVAGQVALYCFAQGHGGAYASLALPATAAKQILVPTAIALFFGYTASRRWPFAAALALAFGALALTHITYAVFLLIPLGAYAVLRLVEWRATAIALLVSVTPVALTLLWLRPIVDETLSRNPSPTAKANAFAQYSEQLQVWSPTHYRLLPEVTSRSGAVAVGALVLVPLAGFAVRRTWGAFVLGGAVSLLALMLVPTLFTHFSDAVSLSQSRRAAGFVPFAFAFAGGLALLARTIFVIPVALVVGIYAEGKWPGDFVYGLDKGGPATATWIAFIGGAAAIVLGLVFRLRPPRERYGVAALAAIAFVLPIAWHGFARWTPRIPSDPHALSPALAQELKAVPARAVVIAPLETSYRILAAAPVYVVAAPVVHVANTTKNLPYQRRTDVLHWLATDDPAVVKRYGATWGVRHGHLYRLAR